MLLNLYGRWRMLHRQMCKLILKLDTFYYLESVFWVLTILKSQKWLCTKVKFVNIKWNN